MIVENPQSRLQNLKVLLTGGSGTLGLELIEILEKEGALVFSPSSEEFDVSREISQIALPWKPDLIIHAAAWTDVAGAEKEENILKVVGANIIGSKNVSFLARTLGCPVVYISSDYVTCKPLGLYAYSKLAGEAFMNKDNDLIVRTSFKPRGTWGPDAFTKVVHPVKTNADWVDIIAPKIVNAIANNDSGIVYIGTKVKTLKDLATQEYSEVEEITPEEISEVTGYIYPQDCTFQPSI